MLQAARSSSCPPQKKIKRQWKSAQNRCFYTDGCHKSRSTAQKTRTFGRKIKFVGSCFSPLRGKITGNQATIGYFSILFSFVRREKNFEELRLSISHSSTFLCLAFCSSSFAAAAGSCCCQPFCRTRARRARRWPPPPPSSCATTLFSSRGATNVKRSLSSLMQINAAVTEFENSCCRLSTTIICD
jgi:hypothetical protein